MADYFSDAFIEEVLANNDIVDVISEYVRLEKKGKDYFGLCPFHGERTPSFSVVPRKQMYYCFGCGAGGNAIHFIMNIERLDFVDAVKHLTERAKMSVPVTETAADPNALLKREILNLNKQAARFFFSSLYSSVGDQARQYIEQREIPAQLAKSFGIGYATPQWHDLYNYIFNKGFSEQAIQNSGLFNKSKKDGKFYDRFRDRIMFPIFDIGGQVVAFGGRVFKQSDEPKYVNSPETLVYTKGRHLYALNFAKMQHFKQLILVEGYMDVVALHKHGFTNSVASLGTALTENQGRLIKKYAEEVIICYDADNAGQSATMRGIQILTGMGCNTRILTIDDGKDPDEFLKKHSPEDFQKLLDNADSLTDYRLKQIQKAQDIKTPEDKIELIKKIALELAKMEVLVEREIYIERAAKEYNVSVQAITELVEQAAYKNNKPRFNNKINKVRTQTKRIHGLTSNEQTLVNNQRMLLAVLVQNRSKFDKVVQQLPANQYFDPNDKQLAEYIYSKIAQNEELTYHSILNFVKPELAGVYSGIFNNECDVENPNEIIDEKLTQIQLNQIDVEIESVKENLINESSEEKKQILMQELNSLIHKRMLVK